MVESIPKEFVHSWGSIKPCEGGNISNKDNCRGLRLTKTMMLFKGYRAQTYCNICYEQFHDTTKSNCVPVRNDAKFNCPERNCDAKLYFHEFIAGKCCEKSLNKSLLPEKHENHRPEFQDLKKMMNLLEISEKEENDARKKMESKEKNYKSTTALYNQKNTSREESRSNLASSFTNAGLYIAEDKDKSEKDRLQELKIKMEKHEATIKEEEIAKKIMDEDKKALDEATSEYLTKKEKREQVRDDLSSSFMNTAKDLIKTEEVKETYFDKCNVCFEKYNKLDRHSCAPKCGHLTCQKCLNELPEKLCPICREPFAEDNVIKVYLR